VEAKLNKLRWRKLKTPQEKLTRVARCKGVTLDMTYMNTYSELSTTRNIVQGRIQGGGNPARAPLKFGKIWFFTRNTPEIFSPPSASPLKLEKIRFFGVKSWFFIRNTPKLFAPPSARRNFFKCALPLTWNPGSSM
jgi:hypothetical protein